MDPDRLAAIALKHHIVLLLQFGSTVTGRTHAASDVDLAVLMKQRPPSWAAYSEIIEDLQSLIPDRKVDVALLNGADPLFLKKITEQCQLLHGSTRALQELRIYAFTRYQDHRRFLAMERAYVTRTMLPWRDDRRPRARHAQAAAHQPRSGHARALRDQAAGRVPRGPCRSAGGRAVDGADLLESLQAARDDIVTYVRSVEAYLDRISLLT